MMLSWAAPVDGYKGQVSVERLSRYIHGRVPFFQSFVRDACIYNFLQILNANAKSTIPTLVVPRFVADHHSRLKRRSVWHTCTDWLKHVMNDTRKRQGGITSSYVLFLLWLRQLYLQGWRIASLCNTIPITGAWHHKLVWSRKMSKTALAADALDRITGIDKAEFHGKIGPDEAGKKAPSLVTSSRVNLSHAGLRGHLEQLRRHDPFHVGNLTLPPRGIDGQMHLSIVQAFPQER